MALSDRLLGILLSENKIMRNLCKTRTVLLAAAFLAPVCVQAQTTCSNSSLTGTYFYFFGGNFLRSDAGFFVPYAESGKFTADGNGGITGQGTAYIVFNSGLSAVSLSGTYNVKPDCSATLTLTAGIIINLQILSGGSRLLLATATANFGDTGEAYRAANASGSQCGNGWLSGTYSYTQVGGFQYDQAGDVAYSSEIGQVVADGNGNITTTNIYTAVAGGASESGTGTYTINSDCSGTYQVTYPGSTTPFTYNIALVEGNTLLFLETDGFAVTGVGHRQSPGSILPQFVFGAGTWYSALYFTNPNSYSVTFTVNFTADGGTPLTVPSLGGSSVSVTIPPNGTSVLEAPNSGSFGEGYATAALPAGVTGYGIFRQTVSQRDQEAVVPLASAASTTSTLAWDETVGTVSLAIANPSAVSTNVTITVWDTSGNNLGTSPPIPLSANSKTEGNLDTLAGISLAGKRGSAQFSVTTGNVAVLGLRFIGGGAFTSIPATGN